MRVRLAILCLVAFAIASSSAAVTPSAAVIETIPVGNTETIVLNVEEASAAGAYPALVRQANGTTVAVQLTRVGLKLTTGNPPGTRDRNLDPQNNPVPFEIAAGRPAAMVIRNLTPFRLRITLQQPMAPPGATPEQKGEYCTPACKDIDPAIYFREYCDQSPESPGRCTPKPELANCGSAECEAIRKACDRPNCAVDLYKALEACLCSVTKVLSPSTYRDPNPSRRATRLTFDPAGAPVLQTDERAQKLDAADIAIISGLYGLDLGRVKVQQVAAANLPDYPVVLFDAALFSAKDGSSASGRQYRLLIEQDPAPPERGGLFTPPAPVEPGRVAFPVALPLAEPVTVSASPNLISERRPQTMRVVVVPLDETGVANWRYLNPRNPACVNCRPGGEPLAPNETPAGVVFRNRTQDRTFLVSLTLPGTAPATVDESFKCTAGQPCKISRSVAPGNTVLFDASILSHFGKSLIKFDVSLYGETIALGNPSAYLSLSNPFDDKGKSTLVERASATNFKTKLSLSGRLDPSFPTVPKTEELKPETKICTPRETYSPDNEPILCFQRPFTAGTTQFYRGSGSLQLNANLSDRADGSATLSFRDGFYGAAEIDKTTILDYQVSIYGTNGLSLKLGKTDFLIPSQGIAIAESGEGFLYSWRSFGLGHVIRRESTAGQPLQTNQDKKDWFFQARSLSLGQRWRDEMSLRESEEAAGRTPTREDVGRGFRLLSYFRSADLYAVRGEDKLMDSNYLTYGGEVFIARPASRTIQKQRETLLFNIFSGSIAAYQSSRDFDNDADCRKTDAAPTQPCIDGRGHVWLATLTWTPSMVIATGTNAATTPHTVTLVVGAGSGDNPSTTTRDEGYIGEPAGYAPDRLFLKLFVPRMNSKNVQYEPLGLSNKRYVAITYTNSEWTLLDLVASALRVREDVNSRSIIVTGREYQLRYGGTQRGLRPIESLSRERGAAREINLTSNIEVPKGVTFSIDASWMDPGAAFKDVIGDDVWTIGANVTLSL